MITPKTLKELIDTMAGLYGGKFVLVPRMIYDTLARKYGEGVADQVLKKVPAGVWRARKLPQLGHVGGEVAFVVMLYERRNGNEVTQGALYLFPRMPTVESEDVVKPARILELSAREETLARDEYPDHATRRSLDLTLGSSIAGFNMMRRTVDEYGVVREIMELAEVGREFPVLVPRNKLKVAS